jgi:hypothetical protein
MPTSHNTTDVFSDDDGKLSVETTRVAGGMANLGIDRHSIGRPGQPPTFSVVEKRMQVSSRFRREYNLYSKIHKASRAGLIFSPLPYVISAEKTAAFYSTVMPYYEGVGRQLEDLQLHGQLIGRTIYDFNNIPIAITAMNRMENLAYRLSKPDGLAAQLSDFAAEVLKVNALGAPDAWDDEIVKSHNDLFYPNIATQTYEKSYNIVYIDLGHVAMNHIGADFHHFVRSSYAKDQYRPLLDSGIAEYTRLTGKNRNLIMFNAYRYALLRLIERANKYYNAKKHNQFDQEVGVGRRILADLLTFQR